MSAGPGETIRIGPTLLGSAAVALRHRWLVLLSLAGLAVWSLLIFFAITRCLTSPACVAPENIDSYRSLAKLGIWFGIRFIAWFILGALVYRILIAEAGIDFMAQARDPRLRLFLACVLCFASLSLAGTVVRVLLSILLHALGAGESNLDNQPLSLSFLAEGALMSMASAYLAMRFALFAAFLLRNGDSGGFSRSWTSTSGTRLRIFVMFLVIGLALYAIEAVIFFGWLKGLEPAALWLSALTLLTRDDALEQAPGLIVYPPYVIATAAFYAGAFVTIFRRLAGSEARVFD
jgi:hypothetical protein